ncbi:MAG: hypothetical protein ACRDK7_01415 [Solirubrobacteraceae bacterium]
MSLAAISVAAVGITACGSTASPASSNAGSAGSVNTQGAASFIGKASNAVMFVQWTRADNNLSGSLHEAILKQPAGSGVESANVPFTGSVSGDGLTLQLERNVDGTMSLSGQFAEAGFTLTFQGARTPLFTVTFASAQVADYNGAVRELTESQYGSPCRLYLREGGAELTITGHEASSDCTAFIADDPGGETWTTQAQQPAVGQTSEACELADGTDRLAVVQHSGDYGQKPCEYFSQQGWTPTKESRERQQAREREAAMNERREEKHRAAEEHKQREEQQHQEAENKRELQHEEHQEHEEQRHQEEESRHQQEESNRELKREEHENEEDDRKNEREAKEVEHT